MSNLFRAIPSISELLKNEDIKSYPIDEVNKHFLIEESLYELRYNIGTKNISTISYHEIVLEILEKFKNSILFSLRKVINATGVILHTNLGRSILPTSSIKNFIEVNYGYSNIEYNLKTMRRGDRETHLNKILSELTDCEDSCVVNNNAGAVFLVLNTFSKNKKVLVSRGENVEIGGSFRIPDIIKASGAKIVDVGTTNKTYLKDYQTGLLENKTANMILKIHKSNYDIVGFNNSVSAQELASIKNENIILVEDQGSGSLIDLTKYNNKLTKENTVRQSLIDGVDLVLFSGDKLLGSAQAGIIVGKKELISKIKKNQLFRMLRSSKVVISLLEVTLEMYKKEKIAIKTIPTLRMICENINMVKNRVKYFIKLVKNDNFNLTVVETKATIGGGSLPKDIIDSYGVNVEYKNKKINYVYEKLVNLPIPVIGTLHDKKLILDFKTIQVNEIEIIARFLNDAKW